MKIANLSVRHDAALHIAWSGGDLQAGSTIISAYKKRIYGLGVKLGLSSALAEELSQEVLLQAATSTYEPRPGCSYWDWLSAIARNLRRRVRERDDFLDVRRITSPWSGFCRLELLELIEEMPAGQREVFRWLLVGLNSVEIAEKLGIDDVAVRMRIHRGRKWLRAQGY